MPRKKQAESAKSRRQKLLSYFHDRSGQAKFISDVKNDLGIKNEQNLRRDLEMLAEQGILGKSKDTSKLPARAVYTLKNGAPTTLNESDEAEEAPQAVAAAPAPARKSEGRKAAKAQAEPAAEASAPSSNGDVKGRRSARELEQQILQLLEAQPTTVKDLADHLKRQQPTVTKALERMQERRLVDRKRQGRSFVYYKLSTRSSAASAPAAAALAPQAETSAAAVAPQVTDTGSFGLQNLPGDALQSVINAAVQAAVSAALDHIMANRR